MISGLTGTGVAGKVTVTDAVATDAVWPSSPTPPARALALLLEP